MQGCAVFAGGWASCCNRAQFGLTQTEGVRKRRKRRRKKHEESQRYCPTEEREKRDAAEEREGEVSEMKERRRDSRH